jgi:hypothetical protein
MITKSCHEILVLYIFNQVHIFTSSMLQICFNDVFLIYNCVISDPGFTIKTVHAILASNIGVR